MKPWSRLVAAVLLVPFAASISRGTEPPAARQFQIVMSMKQGDPLGSRGRRCCTVSVAAACWGMCWPPCGRARVRSLW